MHRLRKTVLTGALAYCLSVSTAVSQTLPTPQDIKNADIQLGARVPSTNLFGAPGILDLPSAEMLPDGQLAAVASGFAGQYKLTSYFQLAPWLGFGFRYSGIRNTRFNRISGYDPYYDRGFDMALRLATEGRYRPAITLGLRDFAGTGVYASEYIVATKNFTTPGIGSNPDGQLKVTAGLGWGRLGTNNPIGSTGTRSPGNDGVGDPEADTWFRGDYAPFAGIEWIATPRWGIKAEYSSDIYADETIRGDAFTRRSSLNFGVDYKYSRRARIGLNYMFGDAIGFRYEFNFNPANPITALQTLPSPNPVQRRPNPNTNPAAYATSWSESREQKLGYREQLAAGLREEGVYVEDLTLEATSAEVWIRNTRYFARPQVIGRTARVMARILPASIETFRIVPTQRGVPLSTIAISRSALETMEFESGSAAKLLASSTITDAPVRAPQGSVGWEQGLYPDYSWGFSPYFEPGFFDPVVPFRLDVGIALNGFVSPAPGWVGFGQLRYRLFGNLADGRKSNSVLPRVRTNQVLYAQDNFNIENLVAARYAKLGEDVFGRVSVGYLEQMFGGISTEVLWKPVTSPLGIGVEANYVKQRAFDGLFGFQDYEVFTGHASIYAEFGDGYLAQVDAGQYLAGDVGASFRLNRYFDNGWRIGAFFTLTDVSAEDFGEGSFDKGFVVNIPVTWLTGRPSPNVPGTTIRVIQRDGGQMLNVPGRLYGSVRVAHERALEGQWARVWQ